MWPSVAVAESVRLLGACMPSLDAQRQAEQELAREREEGKLPS